MSNTIGTIDSIKQQILILEGIQKVCSDPTVKSALKGAEKDSQHFESFYKTKVESLKKTLSDLENYKQ